MSRSTIEEAISSYRRGEFVIVYDADGREEECDLFLPAEVCHWEHVGRMRKDGGGLIFLMVRPDIRDALGLPFLQSVLPDLSGDYPVFRALISDDIPYDTRSSFSVYINHRDTFTGITDRDRALTVRSFGELAKKVPSMKEAQALAEFGEHFRSPGHVPICIASDRILETRFGHTELSCALSTMAGLSGVSVGCEIMGDDGNAMEKNSVMQYAEDNSIPFLKGSQIIEAWKGWEGAWKREYVPPERQYLPGKNGRMSTELAHVELPEKGGVRVMASGVFDLMHPGHLHFLRSARALGEELVVVVARDSTVRSLKRHPVVSERERREMVASLRMVDIALLGYEGDRNRIVREIDPDIIALGYDQEPGPDALREELAGEGIRVDVVRLDHRAVDLDATTKLLKRIQGGSDSG